MTMIASETIWKSFMPFILSAEEEILELGRKMPVPRFDDEIIHNLCNETFATLMVDPTTVMDIDMDGYYVVGDIHGNLVDLLRILSHVYMNTSDFVPRIIFLGDYVDRGSFSLEVVLLLFAMKNKYPDTIHLIRGNHEFPRNRVEDKNPNSELANNKLLQELTDFYDVSSATQFESFIQLLFQWLPIAIVLNKKFLLIHGGLSSKLKKLDKLRKIPLPIQNTNDKIISDVLWSDPSPSYFYVGESPRGVGIVYGRAMIDDFLQNNNLKLIIRGHQSIQSGIASKIKGVMTVFSTSNYNNEKNLAGFIRITNSDRIEKFYLNPIQNFPRREINFSEVIHIKFSKPKRTLISTSASKLPPLICNPKISSSPILKSNVNLCFQKRRSSNNCERYLKHSQLQLHCNYNLKLLSD